MIPEQSLVSDQGRKYVFVLEQKLGKDGRPEKTEKGEMKHVARRRDVGEVGVLRNGYREIEKGIKEGDLVVRAGMQRLKDGLEVVAEKYKGEPAAAGEEPAKVPPTTPRPVAAAPAARPAAPAAAPSEPSAGAPSPATTRPASRLRGAGEPRTGKSR